MSEIDIAKDLIKSEWKIRSYNFFSKLKLTWYFNSITEKIIITLGVISLIYSIVRILIRGFW